VNVLLNENGEFFWCSKKDCELIFKRLQHLKHIEHEDGIWNDQRWLYFDKHVLDRYKENKYSEIDWFGYFGYLIFYNYSEEEEKLSIEFIPKGKLIKIQAREFVHMPPKEENHWLKFQVKTKDEYPGI